MQSDALQSGGIGFLAAAASSVLPTDHKVEFKTDPVSVSATTEIRERAYSVHQDDPAIEFERPPLLLDTHVLTNS